MADGTLWGTGVTVLGYVLGRVAFVKSNVELILVGIVLLSVLPIGIERLRARHRADRQTGTESDPAADMPRLQIQPGHA